MDIQQIKLSGEGIGWGAENFTVWAGAPVVVAGSEFQYCDPMNDPEGLAEDYYWGDAEGNKVSYSIAAGQAFVIECAEGIKITTSGEVAKAPISFTTVEQNNFTGNPFPVAIDIQNIKIAGEGIGWGAENLSIWEGAPEVVAGSEFQYCDPMNDPAGLAKDFYWGDAEGNKVSYSIPTGKAVVIECTAGLNVTIKPPYSL